MANKKVQIQIDTKANTAGAKQAEQSLKSLDQAVTTTGRSVQATTASTSKLGTIAGQAGFQIQDFAVQVQGGTSAVTAFSQQAPQLLGALGPQGAIAGAVVALGAIAASTFVKMAENAAVAGEAMEDVGDKFQQAVSAAATKAVEDFSNALENAAEASRIFRDAQLEIDDAMRRREQSNTALIQSQLKLDEAQIKYLQSTGQIKDAEEALLMVRQKAVEAQKAADIAAAQGEVDAARARYQSIIDQRAEVESEVARAEKRLVDLERQQQELQPRRAFYRSMDAKAVKEGLQPEGFVSAQTRGLDAEMQILEEQIKNIYKIIQGAPQKLEQITLQTFEQAAAVDVAVADAQTKISEIESKFALTQKAEQITQTVEDIGQQASDISKAIEGFQPIGALQVEAKAEIQQAVADGQITVQEQQKITSNLQMLMNSLRTGQQASFSTLQKILEINNELTLKMSALNKETNALRQRVNALQLIR